MSEIHEQLVALEKHRKDAEAAIERRDTLLRLSENKDFKRLIREEFMVRECARFVEQSVNPVLKPEERSDALAKAQAAGHLKQYLSVIILQGNTAENSLVEIDEHIAELRALESADDDEDSELS